MSVFPPIRVHDSVPARTGLSLFDTFAERIGLPGLLSEYLAERRGDYSSQMGVLQLMYGLAAGGKGLSAAEIIRQDEVLKRAVGFEDGVAEEATMVDRTFQAGFSPPRRVSEAGSHLSTTTETSVDS